uniref:DUF4283 domain-containing protein n=1 Tax=Ananas comosus var. bracteatus TaxID=296719 RepID=A0A6V7P0F5_ANACO|nr:unnamed protein product [Ananas comosus var. bracteatus]
MVEEVGNHGDREDGGQDDRHDGQDNRHDGAREDSGPCPRQLGDPLRRSIERTGAVNVISSGLSIDLERRFQELKHHLGNGVMATTHPSSSSINDRSLAKKVIWADSAGLDLAQVTFFSKDDSPTAPTPSAPAPAVKDTDGKGAPADQPWTEVHYKRNGRLAPPGKPSYKEALLSAAPPSSSRNPPSPLRNALSRNPPPPPLRFAPAHRSRASLPSRHPPPPLRNTLRNTPPSALSRIGVSGAWDGTTERPLAGSLCDRRLLCPAEQAPQCTPCGCRPPANLGHFAQDTIANGLANRFGGFPTDFLVARYREREFVVFLPEWVPSDSLVRRLNLSLGDIRLRCHAWNPYSGARRFSPPYKAWIRLVSLPYECWSSRTVAAIVGGFALFIRADEHTTRIIDLSGYRCLVAVNHLHDIPENLEVAFGDLSMSVLIQLQRWARDNDIGRGDPPPPPNERTDHFDPDMRSLEVERRYFGEVRARRPLDDIDPNSDGSSDSFEIRDRRHGQPPSLGLIAPLELGSVPVTKASPTSLGSGSAPVAEASLVSTGLGPAGTPVGDASADPPAGDASADRIPYPKGQICLSPNLSSFVQVDLPVGESTGLPADHASLLSHPRSPSACCWKTSPSDQAGISFCRSLVYREKSCALILLGASPLRPPAGPSSPPPELPRRPVLSRRPVPSRRFELPRRLELPRRPVPYRRSELPCRFELLRRPVLSRRSVLPSRSEPSRRSEPYRRSELPCRFELLLRPVLSRQFVLPRRPEPSRRSEPPCRFEHPRPPGPSRRSELPCWFELPRRPVPSLQPASLPSSPGPPPFLSRPASFACWNPSVNPTWASTWPVRPRAPLIGAPSVRA